MLNDLDVILTAIDQIIMLEDAYRCGCKNELLGRQVRVIVNNSEFKQAIANLKEMGCAGGDT